MKQDVDDMIPRRTKSPPGMFKAKHGVNEWEVLRGRIQREPNPAQTVRSGQQFVVGYVSVVVPNETAVPRRLVSQNRGDSQKQRQKEIASIGTDQILKERILHLLLDT